jgi:potassium channel subfamily K
VALTVYEPPIQPNQIYSQAYWYAVIAAVLYALCAVLLMANMTGYMLGHYTERFSLTDAQRTLILQSFMFFIWLGAGAGVFTAIEGWNYSNALYYCDVTVLTIGFGDVTPFNNGGRALVIPYALGGVLILGLLVSSISRFASELGTDKVIRKRFERSRSRTLEKARGPSYSAPVPVQTVAMTHSSTMQSTMSNRAITWRNDIPVNIKRRMTMKSRLVVLKEEKDRFNEMRIVQRKVERFKKYTTLSLSFSILVIIWIVGAIVFWQLEQDTQGMTFFEAFYFCYVSLTTIGYGDFTPQSAGGRPFFVVWSLFAVPSITLLIGAASNTVVDSFNNWTNTIADFTLLPKHGIWRDFINRHNKLLGWAAARQERIDEADRVEGGFPVGPETSGGEELPKVFKAKTIEELAAEGPNRENRSELGRRLAHAIKQVTHDIKHTPHKRYSYEEWAEWTILIRFTSQMDKHFKAAIARVDANDMGFSGDDFAHKGLIEWDWMGEDSPMMAEGTEPEWLLDRLIESMARYTRNIVAFLRTEKERGVVIDSVVQVDTPSRSVTIKEDDDHNNEDEEEPGESRWLAVKSRRYSAAGYRNNASSGIPVKSEYDSDEEGEEYEDPAEGGTHSVSFAAARHGHHATHPAAQVNDLPFEIAPENQERANNIENELEEEENQWDADNDADRHRRGSQEPQHHEGLPGLLGVMDGAWRHGRTSPDGDEPRQRYSGHRPQGPP